MDLDTSLSFSHFFAGPSCFLVGGARFGFSARLPVVGLRLLALARWFREELGDALRRLVAFLRPGIFIDLGGVQ